MTASWKAVGLSYNGYLAIASRVIRRSLKEEKRALWPESEIKIQKWTNGKPGDHELLSRANAELKPTSAAA